MTTDVGYAPDLNFFKVPDDKLQKASEVLNSALQAHQALNSFSWYKKSAGAAAEAVKKEVVALKKELTDQASKQFETLASKVEEKTGVNIRGMVPTGEGGDGGGVMGDIAGKLISGDFKAAARGAGKLAKDEAMKRAAAMDPRLANIADRALSGDIKGAAKSAGDIAKAKALDELRKVNPDAAKYMEEALDGNVASAARSAALDKLKALNPDAAKYVEQAMTGDVKGAAKAAALDQLERTNPDMAKYAKQALDGDIKGAATAATLDQIRKANPDVARYAEQAMNGDVQGAAKAATLDQLKKTNPDAVSFAEQVMNGNLQGAAKDAAIAQLRKANPTAADMVEKVANGNAEDVVKSTVLDQVRKANPEAATYMEQAMKGDFKSAAQSVGMEQLRKLNPEVAGMVDNLSGTGGLRELSSNVLQAAKSQYMDPELTRLQNLRDSYKQEYNTAIQSLTDRQTQLEKDFTAYANEYAAQTGRDVRPNETKFAAEREDVFRRANMAKDAWAKDDQQLAQQIEDRKAALSSMVPAIPEDVRAGVTQGAKSLNKLTQDPDAIKRTIVDGVKARLSAPESAFTDVSDMKQQLGKEGLKMFDGGDSVLRNLSTMSDKEFRSFLQTSKAAEMFDSPLTKIVTEGPGNTRNLFLKQKLSDVMGDEDFEAGPRQALLDTFEAKPILSKARSALADTIENLKSPFTSGSDSTLARALKQPMETEMKDMTGKIGALNDVAGVLGLADAIKSGNKKSIAMAGTGVAANTTGSIGESIGGALGEALETGGELANSGLGVAGLALAIKNKDKGAIAQQSTQLGLTQASGAAQSASAPPKDTVSNSLTTDATDTVGTDAAATEATENAGKSAAQSIGEKLGENLAKDTAETAALDDTGIGEVVDAGLAIGQLVTSLIDLFKGAPKAPAIYTGDQVGL